MSRKLKTRSLNAITDAALWLSVELQKASVWLVRFYMRYNWSGRLIAATGVADKTTLIPCRVCGLPAGYDCCCRECGAPIVTQNLEIDLSPKGKPK